MTKTSVALVTGSLGLVGAAAVRKFHALGFDVVGIDNDLRRILFGDQASNQDKRAQLTAACPGYRHHDLDIRDRDGLEQVVKQFGRDIGVVVHTAAQPSHDWAATDPEMDFAINATATLHLLEACRNHAPNAVFLFTSTNKVYGAHPNTLPLEEHNSRLELSANHRFFQHGIDETMSIDQTQHSLFGVSKVAADLMVQEYASRFDLRAAVFRAGCLTGEDHSGAKAHGFLSYLCKSARNGKPYEVIGNGGKQVRDNLHANDLADAFVRVVSDFAGSAVYNIGGGRGSSVSVTEALDIAQEVLGQEVARTQTVQTRYGDHQWWISDTRRFQKDYPGWAPRFTAKDLIARMLAE